MRIRSGIFGTHIEKRHIFPPSLDVAVLASPVFAQTGATSTPFWTGMTDRPAFERAMDARLANARVVLDKMLAVKGARTIDNTLRLYDDVLLELDAVGSQAQLVQSVHPIE